MLLAVQVGVPAPHDHVWSLHYNHEVGLLKDASTHGTNTVCPNVYRCKKTLYEWLQVQLPDSVVCDASVKERQAMLPGIGQSRRRQDGRGRLRLQHFHGASQQRSGDFKIILFRNLSSWSPFTTSVRDMFSGQAHGQEPPPVIMVDELLILNPHKLSFSEAGLRVMITPHFSPRTRLSMAGRMLISEVHQSTFTTHTFSQFCNTNFPRGVHSCRDRG